MSGQGEHSRAPAYAQSGVNIDAGEAAVAAIKRHAASTYSPKVLHMGNAFAGLINIDYNRERLFKSNYRSPVLGACTDGVGSKLKIAAAMDKHDTVGIDCVAMNVNDLITMGMEPLVFLDYIGISKVVPAKIEKIVTGVAEGCRQCGASLLGGETAELPDIYGPADYDLVGFCAGVAERSRLITGSNIVAGDIIVGLSSSGLHSNGYSLARKALRADSPKRLQTDVPELGCALGEELLRPTRIYVPAIRRLLKYYRVKKVVHGISHITGGGLPGNIERILPKGRKAVLRKSSWDRPPIFDLIGREGDIPEQELFHVFNMGIGMVLVIGEYFANNAMRLLRRSGEKPVAIGKIVAGRRSVEIA